MTQLKKFRVYLDDGDMVYKTYVPAKNKKEAVSYCQGNGNVIKIEDITEDYPIGVECIRDALTMRGFGKPEMELIIRTLVGSDIVE